jgi:hypothetical protein
MFAVGQFTFFPVITLPFIILMTIVHVYSKDQSLHIVYNQEINIPARAQVRDAFIATKIS